MNRLLAITCALAVLSIAAWPAAAQPDLDDHIEQATVRIVNYSQRGDSYSPWNSTPARESSGSGFVIAGGRIMTNAHVVSDARMLLVYLNNDPRPHQAEVAVIGHDCDLALLTVAEPGLLDGIRPLAFGGLPAMRSTVETFGFPAGGMRLSSTRGVVSRIELQSYAHTGVDVHLTVQTDAAINPGNSGGPVVAEGQVVGVAFQGNARLENVGFFIPTEVIEHFLTDAADGSYGGFPDLGVLVSANMENPAARRHAGMAAADSGVRLALVLPGSSADGLLKDGDILVQVEGKVVANDGTVAVDGLRLDYPLLIDRKQVGETLALRVIRDGSPLELTIPLRVHHGQRRFARTYDELPRYFVYAGLVFVPLDRQMLETYGHKWQTEADRDLLYEFSLRLYEEPEQLNREPVVLLRRLDHPVNARMAWERNLVVERVNGRTIDGLASLVAAIEESQGPFHVFELGHNSGLAALDRQEADKANAAILQLYGVPKDRRL
ncbi:MAG: trypsin-like peptidase domain-containing protein [Thermodesulfobacteriota bacterium]